MITTINDKLEGWARAVEESCAVTFEAPSATNACVSFYLFEMRPAPCPRNAREEPPLRAMLRYLVTSWGKDFNAANDLLADLLFCALGDPETKVENDAPPPALWQALGIPPRPGFILQAWIQKPRQPKALRPVKEAIIRLSQARANAGLALGPQDVSTSRPDNLRITSEPLSKDQ